jgi:cardiolipin synthase
MIFRITFFAALAGAVLAGPRASDSSHAFITEPDQGMAPIYKLLQSAKKSIDIAMYEMADTQANEILGKAAAAGVKVRVILDQSLKKNSNQAAYAYLSGHGVAVHWGNSAIATMHQKSIVVDGEKAAIMTLDLTSSSYATHRDYVVIEDDPKDVAAIEKTFSADLEDKTVTPSDGNGLVWSPNGTQAALLKLINSAKDSIFMETEALNDPAIVEALSKQASKDIWVQVTMTNIADQYANAYDELTGVGADVATYKPDAPLNIHGTLLLIDFGGSPVRAFLGSGNLTSASLKQNRELGLILTEPAIMESVHTLMSANFDNGKRWHNRRMDASELLDPTPPAIYLSSSSSSSSSFAPGFGAGPK